MRIKLVSGFLPKSNLKRAEIISLSRLNRLLLITSCPLRTYILTHESFNSIIFLYAFCNETEPGTGFIKFTVMPDKNLNELPLEELLKMLAVSQRNLSTAQLYNQG